MAGSGGEVEANRENERTKRSRAEDFFSEDISIRQKHKSSKKKEEFSDILKEPRKKKRRDRSPIRDDKRIEKERSLDKRKSRRLDDDDEVDENNDKKREKYSKNSTEKVPKESREVTVEPQPVSRYWGGEIDDKDKNDPVFEGNKKDLDDYEVGSRYYDKPTTEIPGADDERDTNDYLVGKRYYEDKPSKKSLNNTEAVEPAHSNTRNDQKIPPARPARKLDDQFTSRTGGAYIPPAKLRLMQASITDKTSIAYQRIAWEALKKSIHGHINKVNTSNIGIIARLLMKENIVRGRGLLCRSILQAQAASTTFTNVYACLVNVINSRFPNIGELLLKRVILQFKRGFKRNDKALCIASCQFIAHLVNQQVAHEIVALEMLTLLLENPTDDSVEVAVAFLKECGQKLLEVSPKGCNAIFDMLRNILHEGNLDKRTQYMIEVVFQVRKDGFTSFPSIGEGLDLVEEEDQYTHILTLDEAADAEDLLNVFKHDEAYEENEEKYRALKLEIIGESSGSEDGESGGESGSEEDDESEDESGDEIKTKGAGVTIIDNTETNLVALRRTIYLTIQSSLDFEECCHKLLKMEIKPGQESELCNMLLDCCAELRSYEKFFGLLAQRFCQINRTYIAPFEDMFRGSYSTVHRLDTNKLRNVARFFAHLLYTDAVSWEVLDAISLNEEDTTSSSRIFIKILFQELAEYMGLASLNQRLKDATYQAAFEGLFPRDNPKNTRFAINFFTSIGLGGLTDELREHLKSQPKPSAVPQLIQQLSSDSSESSSSESSSSESSDSEDSGDDHKKKKKTRKNDGNRKETMLNKNLNRGDKNGRIDNQNRRDPESNGARRERDGRNPREDRDTRRPGRREIDEGRHAPDGRRGVEEGRRGVEEGRRAGEESRRAGEESRRAGDESRRTGEEGRRFGEESRRVGEESRRAGGESRRTGEERRHIGEESRRAGEESKRFGEERRRAGEESRRTGEESRRASEESRRSGREKRVDEWDNKVSERDRVGDRENHRNNENRRGKNSKDDRRDKEQKEIRNGEDERRQKERKVEDHPDKNRNRHRTTSSVEGMPNDKRDRTERDRNSSPNRREKEVPQSRKQRDSDRRR